MSNKNGNGSKLHTGEPAELRFLLPDVWTVEHWDVYSDGKSAYQDRRTEAGHKTFNILIGKFYGAMALLDAGLIRVEAPDVVLSMLNAANREKMDMRLAKEIGSKVGDAIEAAVNGPLPDFSTLPLGITPTEPAIPSLVP